MADAWVALYDADTNQLAQNFYGEEMRMQTGADGYYLFDHLVPGSYFVRFYNPDKAAYAFTENVGDLDVQSNSDVRPDQTADTEEKTYGDEYGDTVQVALNPGDHVRYVDAGLVRLAALGDYVWLDEDMDGLQNEDSAQGADYRGLGVAGVTVKLYDANTGEQVTTNAHGEDISNVQTDENGFYWFDKLFPGDYYVEFDLSTALSEVPLYFTKTQAGDGEEDDIDSDVIVGDDPAAQKLRTRAIALAAGETNPNIDAGVYALGSIGDYVWLDANHNGLQEAGERGINGVSVKLFIQLEGGAQQVHEDFFGNPLMTVTQKNGDRDGWYTFDNLLPNATYFVQFGNTDEDGTVYFYTGQHVSGTPTAMDSDGDVVEGITHAFEIRLTGLLKKDEDGQLVVDQTKDPNLHNPTIDQGLWLWAGIGDYVWHDRNRNGVQDESASAGINGVNVYLYQLKPDGDPDDLADYELVDLAATGLPKNTTVTAANTEGAAGDGNGYYYFDIDPAGIYRVKFDMPRGYRYLSAQYQTRYGGDRESDSDAFTGGGWRLYTGVIQEVPAGTADLSFDLGVYNIDPDETPTPTPPVTPTPTPTATPTPTPTPTPILFEEEDPPEAPPTTPSFLPIVDEEIPYGTLSQDPSRFVDIEEEEVPYGAPVKTGQMAADVLAYLGAGAAVMLIGLLVLRRGRKKDAS